MTADGASRNRKRGFGCRVASCSDLGVLKSCTAGGGPLAPPGFRLRAAETDQENHDKGVRRHVGAPTRDLATGSGRRVLPLQAATPQPRHGHKPLDRMLNNHGSYTGRGISGEGPAPLRVSADDHKGEPHV